MIPAFASSCLIRASASVAEAAATATQSIRTAIGGTVPPTETHLPPHLTSHEICLDVTGVQYADVIARVAALYDTTARMHPDIAPIVRPVVDTAAVEGSEAAPGAAGSSSTIASDDAAAVDGSRGTSSSSVAGRFRSITARDLNPSLGYTRYPYVALGGTFDRLHGGHKVLLTQGLLHAERRLRVGVTGAPLLVKKKHSEMLQPFETRRATVEEFLTRVGRSDLELEVVELLEASGGTNAIPDVAAMVVSPETLPSLEAINAQRAERGLKPMAGIVIGFVAESEDKSTHLSSTMLRERAAKAAATAVGQSH
jgi:cytidyltransferase-like protein